MVCQPEAGGKKKKLKPGDLESAINLTSLENEISCVNDCNFSIDAFNNYIDQLGGVGTYTVTKEEDAAYIANADYFGITVSSVSAVLSTYGIYTAIPSGGYSLALSIFGEAVSLIGLAWSFTGTQASIIPSDTLMTKYTVEISWEYMVSDIIHREQVSYVFYYGVSPSGTSVLYCDGDGFQNIYR